VSGKYLSRRDIAAARRGMEIFNSMLKRGEVINADQIERLHHVVCGCGAEGCIFISAQRRQADEAESK